MEKVLVIDDEKAARHRLERVIGKEGFETFGADSGEEALEIFEKERPGLVITDLRMSGMDGLDVLRAIKKTEPATEVVLLTAYGDYDTVIEALREGALDYLKKPLDMNELLLVLGRYTQRAAELRGVSLVPTILVLEDDADVLVKLEKVLSKEGFNVITGADGEEGVKALNESKIDVVLADIKMPKKDGLEVLAFAKKKHSDIEVIVLTGYGDESVAAKAMREGAVNFLKKPIDIELMISSVNKAFEKVMLNRSILYLKRELDLSRDVLAHITEDKGMVIELTGAGRVKSRKLAQQMIDAMPTPFFVLDRDMNILFSNRSFHNIVEDVPDRFDEKTVEVLASRGVKGMELSKMRESVTRVLSSESTLIESVDFADPLVMEMVKLTAIDGDGRTEGVLAIFCGGSEFCLGNP